MAFFTVDDFSQTEQAGGFWLISLKLPVNESLPEAFDIGSTFWFDNLETPLYLFQQSRSATGNQLQLLSKQAIFANPVPDRVHVHPAENTQITAKVNSAPNLMLLGSHLSIATALYLAKHRSQKEAQDKSLLTNNGQTLALLHSEESFPFVVKPALFMTSHLPPEAIGTCSLLEDWHITNRLASSQGLPGCFDGELHEFFAYWIHSIERQNSTPEKWQVIACTAFETQKKCLETSQSCDWIDFSGIHYNESAFKNV